MTLDMRTTEERAYAALIRNGERHQVNWTIQGGTVTPSLSCLHGSLPGGFYCAAQTIAEDPDLLATGYTGDSHEARDGIIVSRWVGGRASYGMYSDDDNDAEFIWHYEDEDLHRAVPTQRHTLQFSIGKDGIEPVFGCLHPAIGDCHAAFWRDDAWIFPEWHAGPDTSMCTGTIISWWSTGLPTLDELPYWAYTQHATDAFVATMTRKTK